MSVSEGQHPSDAASASTDQSNQPDLGSGAVSDNLRAALEQAKLQIDRALAAVADSPSLGAARIPIGRTPPPMPTRRSTDKTRRTSTGKPGLQSSPYENGGGLIYLARVTKEAVMSVSEGQHPSDAAS